MFYLLLLILVGMTLLPICISKINYLCSSVAPLHLAQSPSYFTYGSHAAFWMGFTPGISCSSVPFLNPKLAKLFRMNFSGNSQSKDLGFSLRGSNILIGFKNLGYRVIGSGAVDWFDPSTDTGSVLTRDFDEFFFAGNTWSLEDQLKWILGQLSNSSTDQRNFVFECW